MKRLLEWLVVMSPRQCRRYFWRSGNPTRPVEFPGRPRRRILLRQRHGPPTANRLYWDLVYYRVLQANAEQASAEPPANAEPEGLRVRQHRQHRPHRPHRPHLRTQSRSRRLAMPGRDSPTDCRCSPGPPSW
jgi:hypothetical protein